MERLVIRIGNEPAVPTEFDMDFAFELDKGTFDGLQRIFNQLCDLTDILGDEYDLDRLRKLAQADREGKIPKYTIGDTIYDRFGDAWEVKTAERHLLGEKPDWLYRCGHVGTDDYCALWSFEILTRDAAEAALRREQDG